MKVKNTFIAGKMSKDLDERLLPNGEYIHAENIRVGNSEGSDVGAVENSKGNAQQTFLDLGTNPETIRKVLPVESLNRVYYFVVSDEGSYLIEHDFDLQLSTIVLKDTRVGTANILNLSRDSFIVMKSIIDSDNNQTYLVWTDFINPPRKINVQRAKSYTENTFTEEDINLIKAPPSYAPTTTLLNTSSDTENNIEQSFLRFSYRYVYLDNEVSALSVFTEVNFLPEDFSFDYSTSTNKSMVNRYNAVKIDFNTGGSNVKAVEIFFKEDVSNNVYLVDTFNKEEYSWGDNSTENYVFSNNKIYRALAENQLFRLYDAVPRLAKSLEYINNRLVFGNYVENYNIVDDSGQRIKIDFSVENATSAVLKGTATPSLKSNRDTEYGISYVFDGGRMTPPLTSSNNTLFIPNKNTNTQNKAKLTINNKAPVGAIHYKIFIKQSKGDYDTIVPTLFYQDGIFVWIKLEGGDVNKLKEGDFVYIKSDTKGLLDNIKETKVLEIKSQDRNFLEEPDTIPLEQIAGVYFKIKPDEFRINQSDYTNYEFNSYDDSANPNEDPIRGEVNVIEPSVYYGSGGLNDMSSGGTYTHDTDIRYLIEIDTIGATDTFRWSKDGGATYVASGVAITGAAQTLDNGVQVTFLIPTGHLIDDSWIVSAKSKDDELTIIFPAIISGFGKDEEATAYAIFESLESDAIEGGANINIVYDEYGNFTQLVEKSYISSTRYDNLEEWFYGDNIIDDIGTDIAESRIWFRRGFTTVNGGAKYFTQDTGGNMCMIIKTLGRQPRETSSTGERAKVKSTLNIFQPTNDGEGIIIETKPIKNNEEIFYETSKVYDVDANGFHLGDVDQTASVSAEITLDVFNCFTWGNGFESYKIKDAFTGNSFNLSTRPSTPIENYGENHRIAGLIHSGVFEQTTNYNAINEFNYVTNNFKDLDDAYGSVQFLHSRNTDLLVFQEDKTHRVLIEKDILYNADGSGNIRQIENFFGENEVPYTGNFGISTSPESFAEYGHMIYHTDEKRNAVLRLSLDGYTKISNYGMKDYFRDYFSTNRQAKKIGRFDEFFDQYVLFLGDGIAPTEYIATCDNILTRTVGAEVFNYKFKINNKEGDITLRVTSDAPITVSGKFAFNTYEQTFPAGTNNLTFLRGDLINDEVDVTITTTEITTYSVKHICPVGYPVIIKFVILSDSSDENQVLLTKMKVNDGNYYEEYATLGSGNGVKKFKVETGVSGDTKFPRSGDTVTFEFAKNENTTADFNVIEKGNKIGYLVSMFDYDEASMPPNGAIYNSNLVTINEGTQQEIRRITFTALGLGIQKYIYLIVNLRDIIINAVDDVVTVLRGVESRINILGNDVPTGVYSVEIVTPPVNGTASVSGTNNIIYTHDGGVSNSDTIVYRLINEDVEDTATVNVTIQDPSSNFLLSPTYSNSLDGGCMLTASVTKYHNGTGLIPLVGDFVYDDIGLSSPLNGNNKYFKSDNNIILLISSIGEVVSTHACTGGSENNPIEHFVSSGGEVDGTTSCAITSLDFEPKWTNDEATIGTNTILYDNISLTTPFDGGNEWYLLTTNKSVQIASNGKVIDLYLCEF